MIEETGDRVYDYNVLYEDAAEIFPIVDFATVEELEKHQPGPDLVKFMQDIIVRAYEEKMRDAGDDKAQIERFVVLRAVNDKWMEHLQTVEYIREGIGLRAYGQTDPLVAYKRETYEAFQNTQKGIAEAVGKLVFHMQVRQQAPTGVMHAPQEAAPMMLNMDNLPAELREQGSAQPSDRAAVATQAEPTNIDWKRVGRNDPCPCGSGKKFKSCHYPKLRSEGVI
jgi:preprotein translocase subunit SecA